MILGLARQLARKGVLGINQRNADFILTHNPRSLYPRVDDKWLTKQLAVQAGMPVPELYAVVQIQHQVRGLAEQIRDYPDFVIKPACGAGGDGIVVVAGRMKTRYRKINGMLVDQGEMQHHVSNILSGMYSLGGRTDKALVEYRVQFDPVFERISYQGVPDVRIIVFRGIPVMSMVRLPTRLSDGKANLHQGAIGAGIDIATGQTLTAVWRNEIVTEHPDTGNEVSGIQVPFWDEQLRMAARCHELTGLGYLGVDLVLDKEKGPLMLEMNARPGLNIQIANSAGLLPRLRLVEQHHEGLHDIDQRVVFAKEHFGFK